MKDPKIKLLSSSGAMLVCGWKVPCLSDLVISSKFRNSAAWESNNTDPRSVRAIDVAATTAAFEPSSFDDMPLWVNDIRYQYVHTDSTPEIHFHQNNPKETSQPMDAGIAARLREASRPLSAERKKGLKGSVLRCRSAASQQPKPSTKPERPKLRKTRVAPFRATGKRNDPRSLRTAGHATDKSVLGLLVDWEAAKQMRDVLTARAGIQGNNAAYTFPTQTEAQQLPYLCMQGPFAEHRS